MRIEQQFGIYLSRVRFCYSPDWDGNAGGIDPMSFLPEFDRFPDPIIDPSIVLPVRPPEQPYFTPPKSEMSQEEFLATLREMAREDNHPPYGHHVNLETWIPLKGSGEGRFVQFDNIHIKLDDDKKEE
jgi:hypothetical protein